MDYETPDGSQFSLREVWTEREGDPVFAYTTISAHVDGVAYTGRLNDPPDNVDEADVLSALEPVPPGCINPQLPEDFTIAPEPDPLSHYLKAPSFTYEDCRPGKTVVADCVLNEASVLERLRVNSHANLISYFGCVVKAGLITHLSLKRYESNLIDYANADLSEAEIFKLLEGIKAGLEHLHSLGLAHNDINPYNICIDSGGKPVIVDFDSCLPFGEKLTKGVGSSVEFSSESSVSNQENDIRSLDDIAEFLRDRWGRKDASEQT